MMAPRWRWLFGVSLLTMSLLLYGLHYRIFNDLHHILIFLVSDVAFVPVEVLLVSLVIHAILERREKKDLHHKLNMVIGLFFHEMGADLIRSMQRYLPRAKDELALLKGMNSWTEADYLKAMKEVPRLKPAFECVGRDMSELRDYLLKKRAFLLRLLGNPSLLGHDRLTEMLWAVTHVMDELTIRPEIDRLGAGVGRHISVDMSRAYILLVVEWLAYMLHLKRKYPYMYVMALAAGPLELGEKPKLGSVSGTEALSRELGPGEGGRGRS